MELELSKYELVIIVTALYDYKNQIQDEKEEGIECVGYQEMLYPIEINQHLLDISHLLTKIEKTKGKNNKPNKKLDIPTDDCPITEEFLKEIEKRQKTNESIINKSKWWWFC